MTRPVAYLGLITASRFSHVPHILKALNHENGAYKSLYPFLQYSPSMSQKIKLFSNKQFIGPLFIFNFIFWSGSPRLILALCEELGFYNMLVSLQQDM